MQKRVCQHGDCVYAAYTRTDDAHFKINGKRLHVAVLTYTDALGTEREFYSNTLRKDPSAVLSGREVPVYADPEQYYVDLDGVMR